MSLSRLSFVRARLFFANSSSYDDDPERRQLTPEPYTRADHANGRSAASVPVSRWPTSWAVNGGEIWHCMSPACRGWSEDGALPEMGASENGSEKEVYSSRGWLEDKFVLLRRET